jgi:methionyl-tRNA formyltransferase
MKIVFCGTPDFSVEPLKQLINHQYNVAAVYTQPDRGAGRGRKVNYSAVKEHAIKHNIDVLQPHSLKGAEAIQEMRDLKPDLLVVVAYGLILPQEVLDIPRLGCWNIHASLLPRWRGAAPIHRALLAGDKTTGVGIMQMEAGLDTGPVFIQHECAINLDETIQNLHDRLAYMGASALIECINLLENELLPTPITQCTTGVQYAHKLEKSEASISWDESAEQINRKTRAFNPWPGVVATIAGQSYKIWQTTVVTIDGDAEEGEIIKASKNTLILQCRNSQLQIDIIQKPGKKQLPISQFMASRKDWYT